MVSRGGVITSLAISCLVGSTALAAAPVRPTSSHLAMAAAVAALPTTPATTNKGAAVAKKKVVQPQGPNLALLGAGVGVGVAGIVAVVVASGGNGNSASPD